MTRVKSNTKSNHRSRIELTLQHVGGISWKSDDDHPYPPRAFASVAFTGSASKMQVSSFSVCGQTGHLLVTSEAIELDVQTNRRPPALSTEFPMLANFNDEDESRQSATGSTAGSEASRPHLKFQLSDESQQAPNVPLAEVNRDSRVVSTSLDRTRSDEGQSVMSESSTPSKRLWRDEDSPMHEIIELNITLRTEDNTVCHEGIAHLVFFGKQKASSLTTMDLPIKIKTTKVTPDPQAQELRGKPPQLTFTSNAFVRVQVEVTQSGRSKTKKTHEVDELTRQQPRDMDTDEIRMDAIMAKLRKNEASVAARAKAFRQGEDPADADMQRKSISRFFCGAGSELRQSMQAFFDVGAFCHVAQAWRGQNGGGGRRRRRKHNKGFGILRADSTMDSTIVTRESLDI